MPSSGLEDLDREVRARRRGRRIGGPVVPRAEQRVDTDADDRPDGDRTRRAAPTAAPSAPRGGVAHGGAFLGLVAPGALGLLAFLLWAAAPDKGLGGASQSAAAYGLALLALPTTLLTGLPLYGGSWRVLLTLATSGLLWVGLGRWAARRANDGAGAPTWRRFAIELAPMTIGVWAGVFVGLGAMVFVLTP